CQSRQRQWERRRKFSFAEPKGLDCRCRPRKTLLRPHFDRRKTPFCSRTATPERVTILYGCVSREHPAVLSVVTAFRAALSLAARRATSKPSVQRITVTFRWR